ncbi:MAG TPA: hypothetical protein VMY76_03080 [Gemmatimonadales bacterium]|nr:hypothetical protein [Gemmatimonadales bacterium]
MLAYVFWHWPRAGVPAASYEALQRRFHAALGDAPPPGFLGSRSAAILGAPWAAAGARAYEDWYMVDGSAALDPLNAAAVTASRQAAHDAAAAAAENGTAGLYLLRRGTPRDSPDNAVWFAKPSGMSYREMYELLEPLVEATGAALWGRQMVLGPTPEFCLHISRPVHLPVPLAGTTIACQPVWP